MHRTANDPNFVLDISSRWVERSFYAEFQLPTLPGSGSFMVGDSRKQQHNNNSVELVASLAPAEANVGAVQRNVTWSLTSPFLGMLDKFHVEAYF